MTLSPLLKRFIRLFIFLVLILVAFFPAIPATVVNQSSNSSQSLRDQILTKESQLDRVKAQALATSSKGFQSLTQGFRFSFNSIFNTWSYSYASDGTLLLNWNDVDVVYSLPNANGTATNIVVSEDPTLRSVLNVTIQRNMPRLTSAATTATTNATNTPQSLSALPQLISTTQPVTGAIPQSTTTICASATSSCAPPKSSVATPALIVQSSPTTPDFSMSATVTQMSFAAGGSSTSTITLGSLNGFIGSTALVATINPNTGNVPATPLNVSSITLLSGASGKALLQVLTTSATIAQGYTITVTATSGTLVHTISISLTLNPDIQISASAPSPLSFVASGSSTSTISLTSLGLTGTVSLTGSVSPSPANAPTLSFNPSSFSVQPGFQYSSTLTISTSASTPSNSYTVTITASAGGLSRTTTVGVSVLADFQISNGGALYLGNGNSGSSSINLYSLGLTGSVSLSANSPSGITTSFGTNPVSLNPGSSGSSSATVSVPSSVGSGSYAITITGTSGSISHTTTLSVNVCDRLSANSGSSAGYIFSLNCSYDGLNLDAKASWNVPSVSEPSGYYCYNQNCDISISAALTDGTGSNGVFAGSLSVQSCGLAGCSSPAYHGFYNYLPSNLVQCSMSVGSGDTLSGEVYNNYFNPSTPSTQYFAWINDSTKGTSCSASGNSNFRPTIAQFIADRVGTKLPKFSQVTVSSCVMAFALSTQCQTVYNSGYSKVFTMVNGGYTEATVGAVSSNSFTITWNTSQGL